MGLVKDKDVMAVTVMADVDGEEEEVRRWLGCNSKIII